MGLSSIAFSIPLCFHKTKPYFTILRFGLMNFGNHTWKQMVLGSYILSSFDVWFDEDVVLLDSIGVYRDSFEGGFLELRGAIINGKKYGILTSVKEGKPDPNLIADFAVNLKSYPNPMITDLHLQFELRHPDKIQISIFDLLGRKIYAFPSRNYGIGIHTLSWNGKDQFTKRPLTNGLYFFTLTNNSNRRVIRKFTVLKCDF